MFFLCIVVVFFQELMQKMIFSFTLSLLIVIFASANEIRTKQIAYVSFAGARF